MIQVIISYKLKNININTIRYAAWNIFYQRIGVNLRIDGKIFGHEDIISTARYVHVLKATSLVG